jgi:hypothetical protein
MSDGSVIEPSSGRGRRWVRPAALAVVVLLVAGAAGTALAAYRSERSRSDLILPGVVVEGVAVGGMTRSQAIAAVTRALEGTFARTVTIEARGHRWAPSARELGLEADVSAAVDTALAYTGQHSTVARLIDRLSGRMYSLSVGVSFSVDRAATTSFVDGVARTVGRSARDARLGVKDAKLIKVDPRLGFALQTVESLGLLTDRLLVGSTSPDGGAGEAVGLPVRTIPPKVSANRFGRTVVVDVTHNRLFLYQGLKVIRAYPVATARPGWVTPPGQWTVVRKQMFPTWYNPAPDGWAANEPLVVPPGPENPMGTRALYLDAPGLVRIHGTNAPSSIGRYESHGCIRLFIPNIEELYDLVPVGTKVLIYGGPPWGLSSTVGVSGA